MNKKSLGYYFLTSGLIIAYYFLVQLFFNLNKSFFYGSLFVFLLFVVFFIFKDKKAFFDYLSSVKLAVALIIYLAIGTIIGTLILQNVDEARYLQYYSPDFLRVIKLFNLQDTYHSIWFMFIVGFLNLNLLFCTLKKFPLKKRDIGFFLIHLSIFVIVLGGSISAIWGVKGYINFHVGETHNEFNLTRYDTMLDKKVKLNFGIRLDKFQIEYYPPDYRVYVYTRKTTDRDFGKPYSFKAKDGEIYRVKEADANLRIVKFFKNYKQQKGIKHVKNGVPSAFVRLEQGNTKATGIFFDSPGNDRFFLPDEEGLVVFKWKKPETKKEVEDIVKERFILSIDCEGKTRVFPVEIGESYDFSKNYNVRITGFVPSFSIDTATGKVVSKGSNPDNPAIHLLFSNKKTGEKSDIWVFQNFPEFSHGKRVPDGCSVKFLYIPTIKDKPVYIVSSDGSVIEVVNGRIKKRFRMRDNSLDFGRYKIVFERFEKSGDLKIEEVDASKGKNDFSNPVVKIEWEEKGKTKDLTFSAKDKQATFLDDGRVALLLRNKNTDPKAYRSYVTVIKDGKEVKKQVIEVNHPLVFGGYYFYQSNYDPKDPNYSGISVAKDPGVYIVFLGFFMLTLGGILRFYFKM